MKKYFDVVSYNEEDQKLYKNNKPISENSILYKILEKYKIPSHLKNIKMVIHKTMLESDNSIIYIGVDKNNKKQYIYGIDYVKRRNKNRLTIFLNVEKEMKIIEEFINKHTKNIKSIKNMNDDAIFSIILMLELTLYIRTGKKSITKKIIQ